jgi:NOL1/NOP2/fmu family ribosome biogenesis protein
MMEQQNKKKDVPPHSKALSITLDRKEYPNVDINYQQAISYLRKEAIVLPAETPKGIVLLTYQNIPIGFAKNIGNRANNLYPAEWKIKSTHIPEHETILELARPHIDGGHNEN